MVNPDVYEQGGYAESRPPLALWVYGHPDIASALDKEFRTIFAGARLSRPLGRPMHYVPYSFISMDSFSLVWNALRSVQFDHWDNQAEKFVEFVPYDPYSSLASRDGVTKTLREWALELRGPHDDFPRYAAFDRDPSQLSAPRGILRSQFQYLPPFYPAIRRHLKLEYTPYTVDSPQHNKHQPVEPPRTQRRLSSTLADTEYARTLKSSLVAYAKRYQAQYPRSLPAFLSSVQKDKDPSSSQDNADA